MIYYILYIEPGGGSGFQQHWFLFLNLTVGYKANLIRYNDVTPGDITALPSPGPDGLGDLKDSET